MTSSWSGRERAGFCVSPWMARTSISTALLSCRGACHVFSTTKLEVSSPGLERKLRRPSHFQKSVGREVKAKVSLGDRNATLNGVLTNAGDASFTIEGDEGANTFTYEDVITAKTVFRWEKAPKPGH